MPAARASSVTRPAPRRRAVRAARLAALALLCARLPAGAAPPAQAAALAAPAGAVHAVLINGGDRPAANYLSHLHHLQDMVALLRSRGVAAERIHVFSADGEDAGADLASRESPPPGFWLLDGTALGARLRPQTRLEDTRWPGATLHPARLPALRQWFETARGALLPGDRLLIFVTDHGTGDRKDAGNAAISLWHERLTVRDFGALLSRLAPGVQVVALMSQCYSGAFADALIDDASSTASGGRCGFFSTRGDLPSYGCYPEGRDRDRIGHAFAFIEALARWSTTAEAHAEVLVADATPDVPLRTSDVYLAQQVAREAAAKRQPRDAVGDALLAEAWRTRGAWEPQLRLLDAIGEAFGTFSPRSLAEVASRERELKSLADHARRSADQWQGALPGLKEAFLSAFLQERREWRPRLVEGAVTPLDAAGRTALLEELLADLRDFAPRQDELRARLDRFQDHATRASEAAWRLEVRQAAVERMRAVLLDVAGRVLLDRRSRAGGSGPASLGASAGREALAQLERCEALTLGPLPRPVAEARRPDPFPPLRADVGLLEEVLPPWLGVRFRAVPSSERARQTLPPGAALLDGVEPGSPAAEAGLQAGDLVLGPPGQPFQAAGELRQWTVSSPRGTALPLVVFRPGFPQEGDEQAFEVAVVLRSLPVERPTTPEPPRTGDVAPVLAGGLTSVGPDDLPDLGGRAHLVFFWATWCGPCKAAAPEVLAFAAARQLPAVAITDEEPDVVRKFLEGRKDPFFLAVASDPLRRSFIAYGVSGTPTIVIVDRAGVVRHRQVGYRPDTGLTVGGWQWTR